VDYSEYRNAGEDTHEVDDRELGTVVKLLYRRGHHKAVQMILAAKKVVAREVDGDWGVSYFTLRLVMDVDHHDDARDDDALGQIMEAFNEVWNDGDRQIRHAGIRPALVPAGWREDANFLRARVSNQATITSLPTQAKRVDGMWFRDKAELYIYRALLEQQQALPPTQTISIAVNPSVRVSDRTWEPDFIVVYKHRSGIIEVDGTSHLKKYANDRSRDSQLEDAGFYLVDRIDVADAEKPAEARAFVERFLARLVR
jgi:hypothetical protein